MGDDGQIGAHKQELEPARMAWNPCPPLITSSFDDVGVLQKKLVPFITDLNVLLART